MTEDRYYPGYHFRPSINWMNDPNGPIFKNGWYHLFFQYNPNSDVWGDIHWGHAKSKDLIHWEMCPIAIAPSTEAGEVHCYSGCAVDRGDEVRIFYTSIGKVREVRRLVPSNGLQDAQKKIFRNGKNAENLHWIRK